MILFHQKYTRGMYCEVAILDKQLSRCRSVGRLASIFDVSA